MGPHLPPLRTPIRITVRNDNAADHRVQSRTVSPLVSTTVTMADLVGVPIEANVWLDPAQYKNIGLPATCRTFGRYSSMS